MTPWQEYLAAAQRVDVVRRAATAVVAEQTAAARTAQEELAAVRAGLALQHTRLIEAAHQLGAPAPVLAPGPAELATTGVPGTPAEVRAALFAVRSTMDAADAALTQEPAQPGNPSARNIAVYAGYALAAAVLQVVAFLALQGRSMLGPASLCCGVIAPIFTFGLGWLTLGLLRPGPDGRVARTPVLGAALSLLALFPLVLLAMLAIGHALTG